MSVLITVGAVWNGLRQDFTGRLGRALRDGLLFLGFAYFVNVFVLWWAPLASFDVLAMHLGLDPVEHEAVLRRLALGTLLEGVAVTTTNGDGIIGLVGWITMTIMVFYLHYQLVVRSMSLITAVPSAVSELIGARDQERGDVQEGNRVFAAVANVTQRGTQTALTSSIAGAAKNKESEQAATEQAIGGRQASVRQSGTPNAGGGQGGQGGGNRPASGPRQVPPSDGKSAE
jgi:hypothetical protein